MATAPAPSEKSRQRFTKPPSAPKQEPEDDSDKGGEPEGSGAVAGKGEPSFDDWMESEEW